MFEAAMNACAGDWTRALGLFSQMRLLQVSPQLITFSTAITCCSLGSEWSAALHLFHSLASPDLIAFNAAISACEKGGAWQHALQLLQNVHVQTLQANLITYNSALSACEKCQQWQEAIVMFFFP